MCKIAICECKWHAKVLKIKEIVSENNEPIMNCGTKSVIRHTSITIIHLKSEVCVQVATSCYQDKVRQVCISQCEHCIDGLFHLTLYHHAYPAFYLFIHTSLKQWYSTRGP